MKPAVGWSLPGRQFATWAMMQLRRLTSVVKFVAFVLASVENGCSPIASAPRKMPKWLCSFGCFVAAWLWSSAFSQEHPTIEQSVNVACDRSRPVSERVSATTLVTAVADSRIRHGALLQIALGSEEDIAANAIAALVRDGGGADRVAGLIAKMSAHNQLVVVCAIGETAWFGGSDNLLSVPRAMVSKSEEYNRAAVAASAIVLGRSGDAEDMIRLVEYAINCPTSRAAWVAVADLSRRRRMVLPAEVVAAGRKVLAMKEIDAGVQIAARIVLASTDRSIEAQVEQSFLELIQKLAEGDSARTLADAQRGAPDARDRYLSMRNNTSLLGLLRVADDQVIQSVVKAGGAAKSGTVREILDLVWAMRCPEKALRDLPELKAPEEVRLRAVALLSMPVDDDQSAVSSQAGQVEIARESLKREGLARFGVAGQVVAGFVY